MQPELTPCQDWLTRWMYVEGNPVNYMDPSGMCGKPGEPPCPIEGTLPPPIKPTYPIPSETPTYPIPTPGPMLYDPCYNYPEVPCRCEDKGFNFLLPSGGYLEGISVTAAIGIGGLTGEEVVYDFATMTRASFRYDGALVGIVLTGAAAYTGLIWGFQWSDNPMGNQIKDDYEGAEMGAGVSPGIVFPLSYVGVPSNPNQGWKWLIEQRQQYGMTWNKVLNLKDQH